MRDLFDDFMEELRKREALARGQDPNADAPRRKAGASRKTDPAADDGQVDDDAPAEASDEAADDDRDASDDGPDEHGERDEVDDGDDEPGPEPPIALVDRRGRGGGTRRRGPGGPNDGGPGRARRMGRRIGIGIGIAVVIGIFLLFSVGLDLWTDVLWYSSVGFDAVFWTRLTATVGLGVGANALLGGFQHSIALQPLSGQVQEGLNIAVGISELSLRPGR